MATLILWLMRASLFLSVLALGMRATPQDAMHVLRRPEPLARALLALNGVMALFAVILVVAFDFRPAVKVALVALAVSPVPPIFPIRALRAGGSGNYTLGLLVAAAVASVVLVPLSMEVLEELFRIPLRMSVLTIATLATLTILLPLAAGIVLHRLLPKFAERAALPLAVAALALVGIASIPVLIAARHTLLALIGNGTLAAFVAFAAVGLLVGHVLGRPEGNDRRVLALATASRHPAIAIAIVTTNFPTQPQAPAAVMLYFMVSALVSAIYVVWQRRKVSRLPPPARETPGSA